MTTANKSIRLHSAGWVTDVRYTEGVGFTGNDELVVKYLNTRAREEKITTCDGALVLARTEFVGVEPIAEDPTVEVAGEVITEAEAVEAQRTTATPDEFAQ